MPFSAKTIRHLRRLLIGLACFATLLFVVRVVEDWRSQRDWARFVNEQQRLGTPITQFSNKGNLRPEDNFFQIPSIQNLLFGTGQTETAKSLRELNRLAVQQRSTDSLEDLLKRLPPLQDQLLPKESTASLTTAQQILLHFEPWETELSTLRSAARSRTGSVLVYPEPITSENFMRQFEEISFDDAVQFSHALTMHARASLAAGRTDDSFEDILVLLRLGAGFCRSPKTLLEFLVGNSITRQALGPWKSGLNQHAWTAAQLATVQDQLAPSDEAPSATRSALATCMLMERNLIAHVLSQESTWLKEETARPLWIPVNAETWLRRNVLHAVNSLEKTRTLLDDRSSKGFRPSLLAIRQHEHEIETSHSPYSTLAKLGISNFAEIFGTVFQVEIECQATYLVCMLERYRLAKGTYPASLTWLVPDYLATVPPDLVTGNFLRYRLNEDGTFALSSASIKDEGDSSW